MSTHRVPKNQPEPDGGPTPEDTEGHSLWISPSASRELANSRNRDIERQARERQRAKEAQDRRR